MGEVRAGFLGTLKSELDDSDDEYSLNEAFEQLSLLSSAARAAFLQFRLRPDKAASLFKMLRLKASDGNEWTVGPTSGSWYRRPAGSKEWQRAALPLGLSPVFDTEPDWLKEGIAAYLLNNAADPEELREESKDAQESSQVPNFQTGVLNPFAELKENSRTTSGSAMEFGKEGEDTDWLLEEWSEFDESLEKLREMRSGRGTSSVQALPNNLPADWDADRSLDEAVRESGSAAPVTREGSEPSDPGWEPQELGGYVNPENFFLPPEDR